MRADLTPEQEIEAATIGFRRQRNAVMKRYPPRHRGGSLWGGHIESACAENAASLALGQEWTGATVWETPPSIRIPDIGTRTEVRWVDRRTDPRLPYDIAKDHLDRLYMLVTGFAPSFEILGYIQGARALEVGEIKHWPERDVAYVHPDDLIKIP